MKRAARGLFDADREGVVLGAGPGKPGQVIRLHPKTGKRHLDWLTWGLLPHCAEAAPSASRPIHARAETVAQRRTFAEAFQHRRALVPAGDYYQRRTTCNPKVLYVISRRDGMPLAIGGLWAAYRWPDGKIERTYCIITVPANSIVAPIHDRMPLVLEPRDWPLWLGEEPGDPATLLRPPADDVLTVRRD